MVSIYKFGKNDIFVPLKVLEEIDGHKKRQDSVGFNARKIIKHLDGLREKGSLNKGLRPAPKKGIIKVCDPNWQSTMLPPSLDMSVPDHIILASALNVQSEWEKRKTIVVSRDINMRVIADSVGMLTQDYKFSQVVENTDKIYSGQATILVDDELGRSALQKASDYGMWIGRPIEVSGKYPLELTNEQNLKT